MLKILILSLMVTTLVGCQQRPKINSVYYANNSGEPTKLNPIGNTDGAATRVNDHIYETLLGQDVDTLAWEPRLATEWTISEDKMEFTFKLRKGVKWHHGGEFTAKDVKYSLDIIFKDTYHTAAIRPYYDGLKEVIIVDDYTVKIMAKDKNWANFEWAAAGMKIFPKDFYEQKKKKSFFNKTPNGTGPYKLTLWSRGNRIVLEKNLDWWGFKDPENKKWNFKKIVLRFISDPTVSLEMLKKGSLDMVGLRAESYVKAAVGEEWGKSVHKVKTFNKSPKGYNFIGWNMKHDILGDRLVRKALYHLVNRKLMIKKFEYNYSVPATGPIYPQSPYHDQKIKAIEFNPKLALKLLNQAGWRDTDGDNILDKVIKGKKRKLSITILEPWEGFMKYLTVFKEDAKKAGVELNLKIVEWNSFIKLVQEKKFDAFRMAWSASSDWNPIQIWHTDSAKGGSNFISFSNKKADRLMTEAKFIHDREERIKKLQVVEKIIINEHPYVWFSYKASSMYGYTNRILREKDTYGYSIGTSYWKFKTLLREDI